MICRGAVYWWLMCTARPTTVAGRGRARAALAAAFCVALYGCSPEAPAGKEAAKAPPQPPPAIYRVTLETSKGPFTIEVNRAWAPRGADHFYNLTKTGFYDGARFYRVVRNYVAQFGIGADPEMNRLWSGASIPDDPVKESNRKGTVAFAMRGDRKSVV